MSIDFRNCINANGNFLENVNRPKGTDMQVPPTYIGIKPLSDNSNISIFSNDKKINLNSDEFRKGLLM